MTTAFTQLLNDYLANKSAAERLELLQAFNRATNKGQAVAAGFTSRDILNPAVLNKDIADEQKKKIRAFKEKENVTDRDEELTIELLQHLASKYTKEAHLYDGELWQNYARSTTLNKKTVPSALMEALTNAFYVRAIEEYGEFDYVANNSVTSPYVDQINCYARAFKRLGMSYTRQIAPFFDTKQNKAYLQIRYKGAFGPRVEKMPYDKVAGLSTAQYKEHNELIEVGKSVEKMSAEIDKRSAELKTLLDDEEGKKCIFKVHENGYIYEFLNQQMNNLATSKALLATFPTMSAVENYKEQFAETMNDAADVMKSYTKSEGRAHTRQLDTINNELGKVRDALLHKMEESFTYEDIDAAVSTLPLSYEAVVRDVIFGSSKNFEENRSRSLKLSEFVKGIQDQEFKLPSTEPNMVTQLAGAFKARFQDVGIQTKDRESIRDLLQILADQPNSRELNDQIKAFQERLTAVMSTRGLDDNRLDRIITLGCYADLKPDPKKISDVENDIKEAMAVDIKSLDKCAYDSLSDVQLRRYFLDLPVPVQMAISIACGGEDHPLTDHQLVSLRIENVKDMISDRDNDFKRNYKQSPEKLLQIAQRANDVYTKYQEIGQPTIYNTNFEAIRERVEPVRKEIELLKSLSNDEWSKQLHANKSLLTGMKLSGSEINCGDQTVKITASLNQAIIQAAPGPLDFETDRTEAIKQSWAAISTLGNTLEHAYNLTNSEGKADYAGRAQDLNARIGVKTAPFVQTPTSALEADELIPTIAIEQEPLCLTIRDDINDVLKTDMKSIEVLLRQQSEAIAKEKKEIAKHLKDSGLALSYGDLVDIPYLDSGLTRRLDKLNKILGAPDDSRVESDDDNPFLIADTQNTNGDAKVRSYASRARQRLETEKRKRAIEKFKNRPWRKIISEWFQGDVKPTKLDITGVRKAMMNSDQRDTEQYDKLYQDMSEINQLAELQRRGLLPNDTGLDFVEPFSVEVGEENNKLSKTIEAIKGAIGKGGNADARTKALENGEKTSNVVEEKLYSQYKQLEKTQTGIIKFHGAYQAYQESIREYVQYLEALGSKQYSVGREQIANLLYQANCCVLGKGTKEQLTKALDEASHALDCLKDGTTIVNSLRELDTKAVNVLNKKEEVQQAYLTAICQDNQIEKDVKKSLEDYRNFRLNTDLDSVIRFVPKDSKRELQDDYRKLLNKERLDVDSKGFESLRAVIEQLQDNRENSNKYTVDLTEKLQKAIDAASVNISLQAVKAVKDDHSGETENALEGLESLIKDALNALKAPKETLEKIKGVNEAIEENIKKNNVQSGEENIVALQEAFRNMKEGEAVKLYQRFGSNKTLLRRLLPDDIPRGEYVGQTLQRMQNKHSNDSAFTKLEAHIDAYYKVPKFKEYIASKYIKKLVTGFKDIPKPNTKAWEDFTTQFGKGADKILVAATRYKNAQDADTDVVKHIKDAKAVIDDTADDTVNVANIEGELEKNGVKDRGLRLQYARASLQYDKLTKVYPDTPIIQLFYIVAKDADYAQLAQLIGASSDGVIPHSPQEKQYVSLTTQKGYIDDLMKIIDTSKAKQLPQDEQKLKKTSEMIEKLTPPKHIFERITDDVFDTTKIDKYRKFESEKHDVDTDKASKELAKREQDFNDLKVKMREDAEVLLRLSKDDADAAQKLQGADDRGGDHLNNLKEHVNKLHEAILDCLEEVKEDGSRQLLPEDEITKKLQGLSINSLDWTGTKADPRFISSSNRPRYADAIDDINKALVTFNETKNLYHKADKKRRDSAKVQDIVKNRKEEEEKLKDDVVDVVKKQYNRLKTDEIDTLMRYGGSKGFDDIAKSLADRSGARDKNNLAKQYAKGLKELCEEGTAQYDELGAFDLLPSVVRASLKESEDLRKAFADTAKSLFVPGDKGPDELLIDFVIDNIPNASSTDDGTKALMRGLLQAEIHSHVGAKVKGSVKPTLPFLNACISAIESKLAGKDEPKLVGPLHEVYHHEINEGARKGIYFVNTEASEDDLDNMFTHFKKLDALRARLDLAQDETLFKTQDDDGSFSSKDEFDRPLQSAEMKRALAKLRDQLNQAIQHFDKQRELIASNNEGVEADTLNRQVSEEAAAFLQSSLNDILPEKYVVNNSWVSTPQGKFIIEDVLGQIDPRIVRHGRQEGQVAVYGGVKDLVDIAPLLKGQSAEAFRDDYEKSVFDCTIQECLSVHNGNKYFSCGDMHHDVGRVYDILTLKAKAVSEHEAFSKLVKDDLEAFTGELKSMCDKEIKNAVNIEDLQKLDELLDEMHDYKVPERSSRGRSQDIERGKSELALRNLKDRYRELKDVFLSTRDYEAKSETEKQFDALEAKFIGRARGDKDKEYLKELREIRDRYFKAIDDRTLEEDQKTEFSAALQNVIDTFDDGRVKRKSRADFLSDLDNRLTSMLNKQAGPNRNAQ